MLAPLGRSLMRFHHRAISVPRVQRIATALTRLVGQRLEGPIGDVLDVGCGDGALGAKVGRLLGCRVRGVDVLLPSAQQGTAIETERYDGTTLPFEAGQFDVVLLSDVLHHARDPLALLRECFRVSRRAVALKDHVRFGPVSHGLLWLMDVTGNAGTGIAVTANYLSWPEWIELLAEAKGRMSAVEWPLEIHGLPWRTITRSELQFASILEPLP